MKSRSIGAAAAAPTGVAVATAVGVATGVLVTAAADDVAEGLPTAGPGAEEAGIGAAVLAAPPARPAGAIDVTDADLAGLAGVVVGAFKTGFAEGVRCGAVRAAGANDARSLPLEAIVPPGALALSPSPALLPTEDEGLEPAATAVVALATALPAPEPFPFAATAAPRVPAPAPSRVAPPVATTVLAALAAAPPMAPNVGTAAAAAPSPAAVGPAEPLAAPDDAPSNGSSVSVSSAALAIELFAASLAAAGSRAPSWNAVARTSPVSSSALSRASASAA